MLVRKKQTGEVGNLPDENFNPDIYESLGGPKTLQLSSGDVADPEQETRKTLAGFGGNVLKSGADALGGIGSAVINTLNPDMNKNTVANLVKLAVGAGELLIPGEQGQEQMARDVGNFYNKRYGITDALHGDFGSMGNKILDTAYNDPVGMLLDASAVLDGGGSAVGAVGKIGKMDTLANVGSKISKVGQIIDPLSAAGKVTGAVGGKILSKAGITEEKTAEALRGASEAIAKKAAKGAPREYENFLQTTGKDFGKFAVDEGLQGTGPEVVAKANEKIAKLQEQYNNLARSGEKIDPVEYVNRLNQKINEIRSSDFSQEAENVAKALEERRDLFTEKALNHAIASGAEDVSIPIDILTDTKSTTYSKVPHNAMVDPSVMQAGKIAGDIGIDTIEAAAPGSRAIGQKLRDLREFKDIVERTSQVGKGSQLFNLMKPSGGGAVVGGIAGGAMGNPLLGMAIGGGASMAANDPKILAATSKGANALSGALPDIISNTGKVANTMGTVGKVGRVLNPSIAGQVQPENYNEQSDPLHTPSSVSQPSDVLPDIVTIQNTQTGETKQIPREQVSQYVGGQTQAKSASTVTSDDIYNKMIEDMQTTGGKNFSKLQALFTIAQKREAGPKGSNDKVEKARQEVKDVVDQMANYYGLGTKKSLSLGDNSVGLTGGIAKAQQAMKAATDQDYADRLNGYKTAAGLALGIINQARGAGTLNEGEYKTLLANIPNENSTEKQAELWFQRAKEILGKAQMQGAAQTASSSQTLPDITDQGGF